MSVNISFDDTPMGSIYFDGPVDDREEELERGQELEAQEIRRAVEEELADFFDDCSHSDDSTNHFYDSNHPSRNVSQTEEDTSHFFTPPSWQPADKHSALEGCQRTMEEVNRMTKENLLAELQEKHSMEKSVLTEQYKQEIQTLRQDLKSALTDLDKVKAMYVSLYKETRVQEKKLKAKLHKQSEEQLQKVLEVKQKCQETHPGMIAAAVTEARQVWLAGTERDLKIQDLKEKYETQIEDLKLQHKEELENSLRSQENKFQNTFRYFLQERDSLTKINQEKALKDSEMKPKVEIENAMKDKEALAKLQMENELEKALKDKELSVKVQLEKMLKEKEAAQIKLEEIQKRFKEHYKLELIKALELEHAKEIEKLTKVKEESKQVIVAKKNLLNAIERERLVEEVEHVDKEVEKLKVNDEVEKVTNQIEELAWLKPWYNQKIGQGVEERVREEKEKMKEEINKDKEIMVKNEQVSKAFRLKHEALGLLNEANEKMEACFASKLLTSLENRAREKKKIEGTSEQQEEEMSLREEINKRNERMKTEAGSKAIKALENYREERQRWTSSTDFCKEQSKISTREHADLVEKFTEVDQRQKAAMKDTKILLTQLHDPEINAILEYLEQKDQYFETVAKVQANALSYIQESHPKAAATMKAVICKQKANAVEEFSSKCKTTIRDLLSGQVNESTIKAVEQAMDILAKRLITSVFTPYSAAVEEFKSQCKAKIRVLLSGQVGDCTSNAVEQVVDILARMLVTSVFTPYSAASTPKSTYDGKTHHICTDEHSIRKTQTCKHYMFDVGDHQAEHPHNPPHNPPPKDNSSGKNHEQPQLDNVVLFEDTCYHTPSSSNQSSPAWTRATARLHVDFPKLPGRPLITCPQQDHWQKNPITSPQDDMKL